MDLSVCSGSRRCAARGASDARARWRCANDQRSSCSDLGELVRLGVHFDATVFDHTYVVDGCLNQPTAYELIAHCGQEGLPLLQPTAVITRRARKKNDP